MLVRGGVAGPGPYETPGESHADEDKHKAPTLPHILPLSLQDEGVILPLGEGIPGCIMLIDVISSLKTSKNMLDL